jgi:uncharacterized membrane protein
MNTLSKTENSVLMAQARESLNGKWRLAIGTSIVYLLVLIPIQLIPFLGFIASILIAGPMAVGLAIFALSISRNKDARVGQLFEGFEKFGASVGAYLLQMIFVILWMLLLIIPGIIAALSYALTFYIIAENDSIGPLEAITKSKEMMQGNKWKLFCLGCRFLGWALLCILTLGIGLLWLIPYMMVSFAKFYDDVKSQEAVNK